MDNMYASDTGLNFPCVCATSMLLYDVSKHCFQRFCIQVQKWCEMLSVKLKLHSNAIFFVSRFYSWASLLHRLPWNSFKFFKCDSFLHFHTRFTYGRVAGAAAAGGLELHRGQQQSKTVRPAPCQDGSRQGRRCSRSTGSWSTSGSLSCVCSQQDLLHHSFLGHSAHMAELT